MNSINQLRPYRILLFIIALIGFFGLNGVFLYYAIFFPKVITSAFQNPISLVFILEAFVMMGLIAWLIGKLQPAKPGWISFLVLSILGGLAFSVPAFLLLLLQKEKNSHN